MGVIREKNDHTMKNPIEQADRLMAYLKGELTGEERRLMEIEMADDEQLRRLAEQLRDKAYVAREVDKLRSFDVNRGLQRLKTTVAAREQQQATAPGRSHIRWMPWLSAAAAAVLIVGAIVLWYRDYTRVSPPQIPQEVAQAMQRSQDKGQTGAAVTQLTAEKPTARVIADIQKADMDEDVKEALLHATRVETYINKEYWLTLPDGTLVHMASGTRMIYPEQFRGSSRDIYLEGEAYFMVAHSKGNRFIVHTAHGDVMEYGTEFDVDTRGQRGTSVVLVEGSISVKPVGGEEQTVVPGERAEFVPGSTLISKVDVAPYRAWNTGKVEFADWTLERLMTVMAKWYNVSIEYADDEMRTIRVSGNFDRYEDLRPTMEALGAITGLHLKIDGRKIMINR